MDHNLRVDDTRPHFMRQTCRTPGPRLENGLDIQVGPAKQSPPCLHLRGNEIIHDLQSQILVTGIYQTNANIWVLPPCEIIVVSYLQTKMFSARGNAVADAVTRRKFKSAGKRNVHARRASISLTTIMLSISWYGLMTRARPRQLATARPGPPLHHRRQLELRLETET